LEDKRWSTAAGLSVNFVQKFIMGAMTNKRIGNKLMTATKRSYEEGVHLMFRAKNNG
jgi:hypothetical protein